MALICSVSQLLLQWNCWWSARVKQQFWQTSEQTWSPGLIALKLPVLSHSHRTKSDFFFFSVEAENQPCEPIWLQCWGLSNWTSARVNTWAGWKTMRRSPRDYVWAPQLLALTEQMAGSHPAQGWPGKMSIGKKNKLIWFKCIQLEIYKCLRSLILCLELQLRRWD